MRMNMNQWISEVIAAPKKKAMPVLSFPAIQWMNVTVKELISSSELQAKGMKLIAEKVDSAAVVSLMDLSVEAECFGSEIHVSDDEVPTVHDALVHDEAEAEALQVPPVGACRTGIYIGGIKKCAELVNDRPVFAGTIGPFSLAGRLMGVSDALIYCYEEPDMVHTVVQKATDFLVEYIRAYQAAGANGVLLAEPLTGLLSPDLAEEFSHPYVRQIIDAVQDDNFVIFYHNCGDNVVRMIDGITSTGARGFHFGNAIRMTDVLDAIPENCLVMGNVAPAQELRNGSPESVRSATLEIMKECAHKNNFVISTGCDIPPLSPWENIEAFFAAVEEFYQ